MFARSITDNISYGLPTVPFETVVEAAQKANAHGFIMELQDGYNTGTEPRALPPLCLEVHPQGFNPLSYALSSSNYCLLFQVKST